MGMEKVKKIIQDKISLIIPAYNEEKYIGICLESVIKNSNGKIFEIIVVDNGSTDKTAEIARKYKEIRVVQENNKGVTRARQRGFIESSGDILAFIDADTKMPSGWIEQIIEEFEKDKNLVCLSGPHIYYDIPWWKSFLIKIYWILSMPIYWTVGYMALAGNSIIKREILKKMNGFDTEIEFWGDDTDTARRAKAFGKVKFKLNLTMYASGRRLTNSGLLKMAFTYASQFFSIVIRHQPITQKYIDIR
jgi:glycosyltransferase involved in cell wall biosynthesis